jgi:hypothetical protein
MNLPAKIDGGKKIIERKDDRRGGTHRLRPLNRHNAAPQRKMGTKTRISDALKVFSKSLKTKSRKCRICRFCKSTHFLNVCQDFLCEKIYFLKNQGYKAFALVLIQQSQPMSPSVGIIKKGEIFESFALPVEPGFVLGRTIWKPWFRFRLRTAPRVQDKHKKKTEQNPMFEFHANHLFHPNHFFS